MKRKCFAVVICTIMFVLIGIQVSLAEDYLSCRSRCFLALSECLKEAQLSDPGKVAEKRAFCETKNEDCLKECEELKPTNDVKQNKEK